MKRTENQQFDSGGSKNLSAQNLPTIADVYSSIPAPFSTSKAVHFETDDNSPFADGYAIEKERAALEDLIASADPDPSDPRYARYMLYLDRSSEIQAMQDEYNSRGGAENVVSSQEATGMKSLGSLINSGEDTMTLHTKEAFRLFMGRAKDPNGQYPHIVGGKRVAAALKTLWLLSGADNPYADWALLRHEELMTEIDRKLEHEVGRLKQKLDAQRAKGLEYSILRSADPKILLLGFKSPYGYAISDLVVQFDYYVRTVKTLVRKDQLSDDQGRQSIRELTRSIRAAFIETARFERLLVRPELRDLCRADFVPSALGEAASRQAAVFELLGPIPPDIYSGRLQPRHSRRRINLGPQEKALLAHVSAELGRQQSSKMDHDDDASMRGLL